MTRPAISYSSTITALRQYIKYSPSGTVLVKGTYPARQEHRSLNKPASIKTTPVRKRDKHNSLKAVFVTPTAYTCSWSRVNCGFGPLYLQAKDGSSTVIAEGSGVSNDPVRSPLALAPAPSYLENYLLIKVLNKLRNSQVNFGVALAEAKQTADLFSKTATTIGKQVKSFRGQSGGSALFDLAYYYEGTKSWKRVPNAWLELQYGWTPLMSDLLNALESINAPDRPFDVQVSKKGKWQTTVEGSTSAYIGQFIQNYSITGEMQVRLRYKLRNFFLQQLSKLGLANPAEIIWEKVPYSFVVDWFLPVGSWLSALGGDFGYDFVQGSRTTFVKIQETPNRHTDVSYTGSASTMTGSHGYLSRGIYGSSPWPGLYFKSPVSPTHIANASALLVGAFRRKLKG